jgi:hypothetical protein
MQAVDHSKPRKATRGIACLPGTNDVVAEGEKEPVAVCHFLTVPSGDEVHVAGSRGCQAGRIGRGRVANKFRSSCCLSLLLLSENNAVCFRKSVLLHIMKKFTQFTKTRVSLYSYASY